MEFDFNINLLLREVITKVDDRLQVCKTAQTRFQDARSQLFKIVDMMGEASAKAQSLPGAITTGRKLEMSDHHLYIMKDPEGSRGNGAVVGILKMGRKRLFVYDRHGHQWEMNPLCVLDFYVHESRQRMGCGRQLFNFMLKCENTVPQHLAVDRPSHKFSSFLAKHYDLKNEISQVNNFVIFEGFFTKRPDSDFIVNKRNMDMLKPADYSDQDVAESNVWHRQTHKYQHVNKAAGVPSLLPRHQTVQNDKVLRELKINPRSAHLLYSNPDGPDAELRSTSAGSGSNQSRALPLHMAMYSRHQPVTVDPPSTAVLAQRPPSAKHNDHGSISRPASENRLLGRPPSGNRLLSHPPSGNRSQGKPPSRKEGDGSGGDGNTCGPTVSQALLGVSEPDIGEGGERASSEISIPNCQPVAADQYEVGVTKSESTDESFFKKDEQQPLLQREGPPMLQREGPPRDYLKAFNLHQSYQDKAGHLFVPPDPRVGLPAATDTSVADTLSSISPVKEMAGKPPVDEKTRPVYSYGSYYTRPTLFSNSDTSWTVLGVLRNQHQLTSRPSGHNRLW